jgi:hypothetical protein
MRGAMPPLPQYAFMAWCSVKAQGQLYLYICRKGTRSDIQETRQPAGVEPDIKRTKANSFSRSGVYPLTWQKQLTERYCELSPKCNMNREQRGVIKLISVGPYGYLINKNGRHCSICHVVLCFSRLASVGLPALKN